MQTDGTYPYANIDLRVDAVDEAGQCRRNTNHERKHGSPVPTLGVAVYAVRSIKREGIVTAALDDPEIEQHDSGNGTEEDGVTVRPRTLASSVHWMKFAR